MVIVEAHGKGIVSLMKPVAHWLAFGGCLFTSFADGASPGVFPGKTWRRAEPSEVGLSGPKLHALRAWVGGRGCVVRHGRMAFAWGDEARSGDVASAMKPVLSTLLLIAVQENRIRGVDERVAEFEPALAALNEGKDTAITWRHLASQTSGYGLSERPGEAYAYNDFALALYYDTLTLHVFGARGDEVLRSRIAEPLDFEDPCTFEAFGPRDRPGRLAVSVRDFARFGLLILNHGRWNGRQIVDPHLVQMAVASPDAAGLPVTHGKEAPMLPGQRSLGGGRNITSVGPGFYSFNWWLNRTNAAGHRLFADAPADAIIAAGHGGQRMLWILPSLDMVVCWNDSPIDDQDRSPGHRETRCNQAARRIVETVVDGPGAR
jgi:CubicO group peptidase (beta-lactamase class C family)